MKNFLDVGKPLFENLFLSDNVMRYFKRPIILTKT
jgi:hypothetical protein